MTRVGITYRCFAGCGENLVRARSRIKTILGEQIRKISPEGAGNMTEAIRLGFDILNKSK